MDVVFVVESELTVLNNSLANGLKAKSRLVVSDCIG